MIIASLLLHCGVVPTATEALQLFGNERTHDGKGVTIPSQWRYVHYYEALLRAPNPAVFAPAVYRLRHIRLHSVPNFDLHGGCDPFFDVRVGDGRSQIFNWLVAHNRRVPHYQPKSTHYIDLDVSRFDVKVKGDVKIVFYDYDMLSEPDKMFHFWFNTGFVTNNYLLFHKPMLDRACKDKACKEFESTFKIEVFLDRLDDDGSAEHAAAVETKYLEHDDDSACVCRGRRTPVHFV
jgi:phosphatidylinositol-3,4,5-trisphosphate 3-phosphatase/dual-specificity protein phosphatase PTEN